MHMSTTPTVLGVFCKFYQALYKSRVAYSAEDLTKFLDTIDLPTISDDKREVLESEIQADVG